MNDHDKDQFEEVDPQAWLLAVEGLFLDKAAKVLGGVSGAEELERIRRDGQPSLGQPRKPESVPPTVGSACLPPAANATDWRIGK